MQLIINLPKDKKELQVFHTAFAEVQKELIKKSIDDLKLDNTSKQKVVVNLKTTLQNQIKKGVLNDE